MKDKLILALSGNDIFSGGGLHADLATYTVKDLRFFRLKRRFLLSNYPASKMFLFLLLR